MWKKTIQKRVSLWVADPTEAFQLLWSSKNITAPHQKEINSVLNIDLSQACCISWRLLWGNSLHVNIVMWLNFCIFLYKGNFITRDWNKFWQHYWIKTENVCCCVILQEKLLVMLWELSHFEFSKFWKVKKNNTHIQKKQAIY